MDRKEIYDWAQIVQSIIVIFNMVVITVAKENDVLVLSSFILLFLVSLVAICMVVKWKLGWRNYEAVFNVIWLIWGVIGMTFCICPEIY